MAKYIYIKWQSISIINHQVILYYFSIASRSGCVRDAFGILHHTLYVPNRNNLNVFMQTFAWIISNFFVEPIYRIIFLLITLHMYKRHKIIS